MKVEDMSQMIDSFRDLLEREGSETEIKTLLAFLSLVNLNLALNLINAPGNELVLSENTRKTQGKQTLDKDMLNAALGSLIQGQNSEDLLGSLVQNPQVLTKLASLLTARNDKPKAQQPETKKVVHEEVKAKNIKG